MKIEELAYEFHEELNGQVTAVDYADDLVVYFQCNDWNNYDAVRKFKITCHGVNERDIQPAPTGTLEFTESHPLLWDHNEPQGELYYLSAPESRYEILGRIWAAHEGLFRGRRPLTGYVNIGWSGTSMQFCKGANGLLASGPRPLLEAYEHVVAGFLKTNYLPAHHPAGGYQTLIFESGFVICQSVTVTEADG